MEVNIQKHVALVVFVALFMSVGGGLLFLSKPEYISGLFKGYIHVVPASNGLAKVQMSDSGGGSGLGGALEAGSRFQSTMSLMSSVEK